MDKFTAELVEGMAADMDRVFTTRSEPGAMLRAYAARLREDDQRSTVHYGCHCDLEEGMEPDGCVIDAGRPDECVRATILLRENKSKTDCEYWRPVTMAISPKSATRERGEG